MVHQRPHFTHTTELKALLCFDRVTRRDDVIQRGKREGEQPDESKDRADEKLAAQLGQKFDEIKPGSGGLELQRSRRRRGVVSDL